VKLYAGTAKSYFQNKWEKIARPFRPDSSLTFTQQVMDWVKQVEQMSEQRRERAQKRAQLKQSGVGLLARELKSLGIR
jgi:hypothetical protein